MRKKTRGFYHILAAVCLISLLSGCGRSTAEHTQAPASNTPTQTQRPAAITAAPTPVPTATPAPTQAPSARPTTAPTPAPTPKPNHNVYNGSNTLGTFVPESAQVDDSWFSTAAFLGDSRTEGLQAYSGLKYGDFFYSRGMNVFLVDDDNYKVVTIGGQKYSILDALARKQYQSVYIMMGINELGYPAASFRSGLSKLLQRVNEIQPNAVIYLQTLPPVNEEVAQKNKLDPSINNTNVATFNQIIKELAAQYKVALIDTGSVYRDQNGSLPANLASDGVHFVPSAYRRWVDYMASHTLSFQSFDASRK